MVATDLEVDRIVSRRDLQRTRAEVRLDPGVGDHGHDAADDRNDDLLADEGLVARIVRIHGDGDIGENRRRPNRGDRDRSRAVGKRVAGVSERVVQFDMLDLEVGESGLVVGAPVDDPVRTVDPPRIPETDEIGHDGVDIVVVHREALARVVERAAEPPELAHDHLAGALEPGPRALEEGLATDLLARRAFGDQLLLDDVLRRDPRVVVPGLPERVEAAHPVPADEAVLHRAVQCVADVELAGDVRRRDADHEAFLTARPGPGLVEIFCLPGLLPPRLDAVRVVPCFHHRSPSLICAELATGRKPSGDGGIRSGRNYGLMCIGRV